MDDKSELTFQLRLLFTEKLCKAVIESTKQRYVQYDKLCTELRNIEQNIEILSDIISNLNTTHHTLKQLRALCQSNSEHINNTSNNDNEKVLAQLVKKFYDITAIREVDICVNKLPSNWKEVMVKIGSDHNNVMLVDSDRDGEQLLAMVNILLMRINTIKARIDISKQLIKVALKLKRAYETSNSMLKQAIADDIECHKSVEDIDCGARDDDIELRKKRLIETVERTSKHIKNLEQKCSIREVVSSDNNNNKCVSNTEMKESPIETFPKLNSGNNLTTTIKRVDSLEEVVSNNPYKCSFDSCSYSGKTVKALSSHTYAKHSNERYDNMITSNKKVYKCQLSGCDYVGLTLHALAIHRRRKHRRNNKKSMRIIKKRKIVQRKSVAQSNATVDNNVSVNTDNADNIEDEMCVTNDNSNLVYDQIIPNIMSAENYFGSTSAELAKHRGDKRRRNKFGRFVKKSAIVKRKPVTQRNATVDNNVTVNVTDNDDNIEDKTRVTDNNGNLVYDQIIPNVKSAENKEINQTANQQSLNNFYDNNVNQIMDNSSQIALNHCTANSPQMSEQLSPVADNTLKHHFPGSGFTGEDGVNTVNANSNNEKTGVTNNNANSIYYYIIQPNVIHAKNEEINQTANQRKINNFDHNYTKQIMYNSPQIGLNQSADNSSQMDEQLSPVTAVVDNTLKYRFSGSGFTAEDGVEIETDIQKTHKINQNSNGSVNQYKCRFPKCDYSFLTHVMLKKHIENHCYFPKCNFVGFDHIMLKKHLANEHNWRNKTAKSTRKSFACKYPNCEHTSSTTEQGLRMHFKQTHARSVAKDFYR